MKLKRVLTFALLLPAIFCVSPAQAHTQLVGENPKSNGKFTRLPVRVILEFNEKLQPFKSKNVNIIVVTDSHGREVDLKNTILRGAQVIVSLRNSQEWGTFKVEYRVVSIDGHPVRGSYHFYINGARKTP